MRVLVTGGAGFIGSHLVDQYVAAGHNVSIIDNLWKYGGGKIANLNPEANFYQADLRDRDAVRCVLEAERPELINHHAALVSIRMSTEDPALDAEDNVLGLLNLLQEAVRVGTRKMIFASSYASYGTPVYSPVDEGHPQMPESPYGITKMVAEHYLRYYGMEHGLKWTALRYGNVYGPRQDPNGEAGVIAIFTKRILANEPVRIDWDGEQERDYVYVGDVVRASMLATATGDNQIFCIGTERGTSVNELYRTLTKLTGNQVEIMHAPKRPGDIYKIYLNSTKAHTDLGWRSQVDLAEGLERTIAFFRENY